VPSAARLMVPGRDWCSLSGMVRFARVGALSLAACNPAAPPPTGAPSVRTASVAGDAPATQASPRPLPAAPPSTPPTFPSAGIAELVAKRPTSGRATFVGYAAGIYLCPTCPPGAQCKPCAGDHGFFCDTARRVASHRELDDSCVTVFGERDAIERIRVGQRHRVEVEVLGHSSSGRPLRDLQWKRGELLP
jgi:hypothetical protein